MECDERTFVLADIPGVIEGAHAGAGLGLQFLRHVERTRALVHVVDASGADGRDPVADFHTVRDEVKAYSPGLLDRPQLIAATKRDAVSAPDPLGALVERGRRLGLEVRPVSAVTGEGLLELKRAAPAAPGRGRADGRAGEPGMRVGLMGGSFDPIHLGHLRAAENAREALSLDEVLFVPAAEPPHKPTSRLSPARDRLAMVALAVAGNPWFVASDLELRRSGPSYTVDTLDRAGAGAARATSCSSSWAAIPWGRWRAGASPSASSGCPRSRWPSGPGRSSAPPRSPPPGWCGWSGPGLFLSASEVRRRVRAGLSIRYLLPDPVAAYIATHGLYS